MVVAAGLGATTLAAGALELLLFPPAVRMFEAFGLPHWSLFAVGAIEVFAGALILIRRWRSYGALAVCCIMTGACLAHLITGVYPAGLLVDAAIFALGFWLVKRERPPFLKPDWRHDPHQHRSQPKQPHG
jgi:uncharacterized membrane protein YphA (DoxX/SURF4 family)